MKMADFNPNRYTITVKLVNLDEGDYFEAMVAELPDIVEYGENLDQVYSLAIDSIETLREAALEQGRPFPDPLPSKTLNEFSGRVTLRMSKSLHAKASMLADQEAVSLNLWIVEAISARISAGFSVSERNRENKFLEFFYRPQTPYSVTENKIVALLSSEDGFFKISNVAPNNDYNQQEIPSITGTNNPVVVQ